MEIFKNRDIFIIVWALLLGIITLIFILVGLGIFITNNSTTVASWIQAIGSIGAIASGFFISIYQNNKNHEDKKNDRIEHDRITRLKQLYTLIELYDQTASHAYLIHSLMAKEKYIWPQFAKGTKELYSEFREIKIQNLSNPSDAASFAAIRRGIANLFNHFEELQSVKPESYQEKTRSKKMLADLIVTAHKLQEASINSAYELCSEKEKISLKEFLETIK